MGDSSVEWIRCERLFAFVIEPICHFSFRGGAIIRVAIPCREAGEQDTDASTCRFTSRGRLPCAQLFTTSPPSASHLPRETSKSSTRPFFRLLQRERQSIKGYRRWSIPVVIQNPLLLSVTRWKSVIIVVRCARRFWYRSQSVAAIHSDWQNTVFLAWMNVITRQVEHRETDSFNRIYSKLIEYRFICPGSSNSHNPHSWTWWQSSRRCSTGCTNETVHAHCIRRRKKRYGMTKV